MNLTRDRMRSIGWAAVLLICLTFTVVLTFKVNAVKSQVRLAERQILAVKQDKLLLETEFQTRASQQQLQNLNAIEFGYQAPTAGQYLEGERQLAALGKVRGPDAPAPIRVASAAEAIGDQNPIQAMVSPLTGQAITAKAKVADSRDAAERATTPAKLSARLTKLSQAEVRAE